MNAEQKIKMLILLRAVALGDIELENVQITADNIEAIYAEHNEHGDLDDAKSEVREGEIETGLECEYSRHYESKAVAAMMPDDSRVGWTYWYGGGKHSEPEAIDWMSEAYAVDCSEEEKVVTVRTFAKAKAAS